MLSSIPKWNSNDFYNPLSNQLNGEWWMSKECDHSPRTQTVDVNGQGKSGHDGSTSARCTLRWVPDLGEGRQFGTLLTGSRLMTISQGVPPDVTDWFWVTGDAAVCWENAQYVTPRALEVLCLQWWVSFQWHYMNFGASHFTDNPFVRKRGVALLNVCITGTSWSISAIKW